MPTIWFRHDDPTIEPYFLPLSEWDDVQRVIAANEVRGWHHFVPDSDGDVSQADVAPAGAPLPAAAVVDPPSPVPAPTELDLTNPTTTPEEQ